MKIDSRFTCVELIAFKKWGCLITCRGIVVVVGFWQLLKLCKYKCLVLLWQQQQFSFNLLLKAVACDVAIIPSKGDNLLSPLVNSFNAMMRWFYRLNECHSTPSPINYEFYLEKVIGNNNLEVGGAQSLFVNKCTCLSGVVFIMHFYECRHMFWAYIYCRMSIISKTNTYENNIVFKSNLW